MPTSPFAPLRGFLRTTFLFLLALLAGLPASAQITNGGFETGTFSGWVKSNYGNQNGLSGNQPYSGQSIQRTGAGPLGDLTFIKTAGTDAHATAVSFPRFGTYCAVVNLDGDTNNANSLTQTFSLDAGFIDPADNLLHIRFAYLPVLDAGGGHPDPDQPYFYVGVKTNPGGVVLYDDLNFAPASGLSGIWQEDPVNTGWLYTDWQVRDIALPLSYIGQSITIEFIGAGCTGGGHAGYIYVDGVAPTIPGLWVSVVANKTKVAAGGTIQYTYTVHNDSGVFQSNVQLTSNPPAQTTLASSSGLGFHGDLVAGGTYTATMTVNVSGGASGTITHDDFFTLSSQSAKLYGPTVEVGVLSADTDLGATIASAAQPACNQVTFTTAVTNNGPAIAKAATATFNLPANGTLALSSSSQGSVTGLGPVIAQFGDIAVGSTAYLYVTVDLINSNPAAVSATVSGDFNDPVAGNNSPSNTFTPPAALSISTNPASGNYFNGTVATLSVTASGGWSSKSYQWYRGNTGVTTNPVGTNSSSYTVPTNVDGTFYYWVRVTDSCGSADSGTATILVYSTHNITATAGSGGSISPSGVVVVTHGNNQTFTITAAACYHISDVLVDGVSQGPFGTTTFSTNYTFTNVTTDHTISATYSINTYALSYSAGANGFLSGNLLQVVNCGSSGTPVLASGTPGSTYRFWQWSDSSSQNPRTDTNVTANRSVTAIFATIEEEPNDTFVAATPVSGPGLCVGRVNPANGLPTDPSDYYRVILPQGATLTATLVPPPGTRYYIYLYNQMGKVVAQGTSSATFRHPGVGPQYYYAVVRTVTVGASNPAYYQLTLNWSPVINPGGSPQ